MEAYGEYLQEKMEKEKVTEGREMQARVDEIAKSLEGKTEDEIEIKSKE